MNSPAITAEQFNASQEKRQRRRQTWRRVFKLISLLILFAVLALIGLYFYDRSRGEAALQSAIAETNKLDTEWHYQDIVKKGADLPDDQNAAIPIRAAAALIQPKWNWLPGKGLIDISKNAPRSGLAPDVIEPLRKAMAPSMAAAEMARKAIPLQSGYYPIPASPLGPFDDHSTRILTLGSFLQHLAELEMQAGKHEEAWTAALAILAADRSFGEEPTLMTLAVRTKLRSETVIALERCLANGKVSDESLAQAQQQLLFAASQPILYFQLRAQRAGVHELLSAYEEGRIGVHDLASFYGLNAWQVRGYFLWGGSLESTHAWIHRHFNESLDAVKHTVPNRAKARELDVEAISEATAFALRTSVKLGDSADSTTQVLTRLNCAATALAIERFRLKNGRWPNSLDEIVDSKLLDKIPDDPYDGKPLRYRKTTDGVVVYSIGDKGNGQGDALDLKTATPPARHFEFRLWDEKQRGQENNGK